MMNTTMMTRATNEWYGNVMFIMSKVIYSSSMSRDGSKSESEKTRKTGVELGEERRLTIDLTSLRVTNESMRGKKKSED
jgi:hypothetical protein